MGGWSASSRLGRQQGQALIYGLFVLVSGLAALFFLFNTGQLTREKTKLVNTTDAVVFSAGLMNARALNYHAYTNRAMVANTVAIAQLVSLSSWVQYASNFGMLGGAAASNPVKYDPFFAVGYLAATYAGPVLQSTLNDSTALENLAKASDTIIRDALMNSQSFASSGLTTARQQVMQEVAEANYRNDGRVEIDLVALTAAKDILQFTSPYSDGERTRFAEVARTSANLDRFVPRRSWNLTALLPGNCATAFVLGRPDRLRRRGGTELVGFDEWRAIDSLSEHIYVPRNKLDAFCRRRVEMPAGFGGVDAADSPSGGFDHSRYDRALSTNPTSAGLAFATSESWGYSGLPRFFDLSPDDLRGDDPSLKFAIRVRRSKDQTLTSEARSEIRSTARLNDYKAQMGSDEMAAVATSEVYFERPESQRDNGYGVTLGLQREVGNLFNPFWQVRLVSSDAHIPAAQALQGVTLP